MQLHHFSTFAIKWIGIKYFFLLIFLCVSPILHYMRFYRFFDFPKTLFSYTFFLFFTFFTILSLICAAIKYLKWVLILWCFRKKFVDFFHNLIVISHNSFTFAISYQIHGSWVCVLVAAEFSFSSQIFFFVFHLLNFFFHQFLLTLSQNRITTNKHDTIHISRGLSLCHSFYQDSIIFPQFFLLVILHE